MNKKIIKFLSVLLVVISIVFIGMQNSVLALTPADLKGTAPTTTEITDVGNKLIGIFQTVGIVISVLILIVLGIKYMMGSAEEKAEYKKTMIPYLIGAVCIFAASTLANIVYNFVTSI